MYCPKCGTEKKEDNNYCSNCGYNFTSRGSVSTPTPVVTTTQNDSDKKAIKIILIVIGCIFAFVIIFIAIFIFAIYSIIGAMGKKSYIDVGYETVPSLYEVTGNYYKMCGSSSQIDGLSYNVTYINYCEKIDEDDVNDYLDYLIDEEGFTRDEDEEYGLEKETDYYIMSIKIEGKRIIYTLQYNYDYEGGTENLEVKIYGM